MFVFPVIEIDVERQFRYIDTAAGVFFFFGDFFVVAAAAAVAGILGLEMTNGFKKSIERYRPTGTSSTKLHYHRTWSDTGPTGHQLRTTEGLPPCPSHWTIRRRLRSTWSCFLGSSSRSNAVWVRLFVSTGLHLHGGTRIYKHILQKSYTRRHIRFAVAATSWYLYIKKCELKTGVRRSRSHWNSGASLNLNDPTHFAVDICTTQITPVYPPILWNRSHPFPSPPKQRYDIVMSINNVFFFCFRYHLSSRARRRHNDPVEQKNYARPNRPKIWV